MGEKAKSSFSRAGIGFGVVLQSICVVFLVIAANYISFNYFKRWDFSRSQKFTLAEQTKQALRQLERPVKVIMVFSPSTLSLESAIYGDVQNLLAELKFSGRGNIEVSEVDPVRDPSRAHELEAKYEFDASQNVLILDYGERKKVIPVVELGDFDLSGLAYGESARLEGFNGEAVMTAALIELMNPEKARIYFLQGHGEKAPGDLLLVNEYFSRQNLECYALNLAGVDEIPEDASAVCIVGPQFDLTDRELEMLQRYWGDRGRLVVFLDPEAKTPNLLSLLRRAAVVPRDDRVLTLQPDPTSPGTYYIMRVVRGVYLPDSAITKRLVTTNALLPGPTQSLGVDRDVAQNERIKLSPLIQAAEPYWGETDYAAVDSEHGPQYQDGVDNGQPIIVAVAAEKGGTSDEEIDVATARMVVVGDADFIDDDVLRQAPGNLDFMVSVINRMLEERSKLTGIAPKKANQFTLNLTTDQLSRISLYTLVIIPGVAALIGLIVGFRRRA